MLQKESLRLRSTSGKAARHERFDELTRSLALAPGRRRALRLLCGYAAGGFLGLFGLGSSPNGNPAIGPGNALAHGRHTRSENSDISEETFELLSYQSAGYKYRIIEAGAEPPDGWAGAAYDDTSFQDGTAAFGTGGECPLQSTVRTAWPVGTQLIVRTTVYVSGDERDVRIMVAADNDIIGVFFDGQALTAPVSHDNCPVKDEFHFKVPRRLIKPGNKVVAFHILDRGGQAFFDTRILGEIPVQRALVVQQCSGTNDVTVPCDQLNDYLEQCGVICPDGSVLKGRGGCTIFATRYNWPAGFPASLPVRYQQNALGQWCASTSLTVEWVAEPPRSSIVRLMLPACCSDDCKRATDEAERQLEMHEAAHRDQYQQAVLSASAAWTNRTFRACSSATTEDPFGEVNPARRRTEARRLLIERIRAAVDETAQSITTASEREPPQPMDIPCERCIPPKPGQRCVNGRCVQGRCNQSTHCPTEVTCGTNCLCLATVEGDIRCGTTVTPCSTATRCVTSASCEQRFGSGWFCQQPGSGCCGCVRNDATGEFLYCRQNSICVPPCSNSA